MLQDRNVILLSIVSNLKSQISNRFTLQIGFLDSFIHAS